MQKQLECTKIKDGLYLGNFRTAQDAEFLLTNKFAYLVNCSIETPNYFEGQGIKYLKFKLGRDKPHKLWDQSLKKLKKLDKFIEKCEQNSMCCLIHSFDGVNRSLTMLVAFLMHRYLWGLSKTLEFVRSKKIFIGLTEHYIEQLQKLEQILSKISQRSLSKEWKIEYLSIEEQMISNTFLNSLDIQFEGRQSHQDAGESRKRRRIVWKDLLEKQRRKEEKLKSRAKKNDELQNQEFTADIPQPKEENKKKLAGLENKKNKSNSRIGRKKLTAHEQTKSRPEISIKETFEPRDLKGKGIDGNNHDRPEDKVGKSQNNDDEEEHEILKLIKKNLSVKYQNPDVSKYLDYTNNEDEDKIYNVTINNFIKPNINILNNQPVVNKVASRDKKKKNRPKSAWNKRNEKINRAVSEKEGMVSNAPSSKDNSIKVAIKRHFVGQSPRKRERKEDAVNKNNKIK